MAAKIRAKAGAKAKGKGAAARGKSSDRLKAVVVAALDRASKQITATMRDQKAKPAEGAYPVKLDLHVAGDITVGAASQGRTAEVRDFTDRELLGGLAMAMGPQRDEMLRCAVRSIRSARSKTSAKAALDEASAAMDAAADGVAAKCGLTAEKLVGARAGSVGGKPTVHVRADVGEHSVSMTVGE